jgi:hypothetical protein
MWCSKVVTKGKLILKYAFTAEITSWSLNISQTLPQNRILCLIPMTTNCRLSF